MGTLLQDLRYALRQLGRSPGFTFAAVLMLALGIAANSVVFSVVNAVILRPLAFEHPEQLVEVLTVDPATGSTNDQISFPNFRDIRTQARAYSSLGSFRFYLFNLSGGSGPEAALGVYADEALLGTLRVRPFLGRGFLAGADQPGYALEAVLSYALWRRRYGADPGIVGRTVTIDARPRTVVGVLPPDFHFPELVPINAPLPSRVPEVLLPLGAEADRHDNRGNDNYWVLGRLAPGVTLTQANSELGPIAHQLAADFPDPNSRLALRVGPLHDQVVADSGRSLVVLLGAVGLVLLIATANLAGLLLARAAARRKEFALRTALGASRGRLVRQLLTESALLGLSGGALGMLLAVWGIPLVRAVAPNNLPRVGEISLDVRILWFTLLISLVTGMLVGLTPALEGAGIVPADVLKEGARVSVGRRHRRGRNLLVVAQMALSLVLLTGAALLLRSFARLAAVDPGFDGSNVITMFTLLPAARYPDSKSQAAYEERVLARVGAIPGVENAGGVNTLPLSNLGSSTSIAIVGRPEPGPGEAPVVPYRVIGGSYFRALRMPIVAGRDFTEQDGPQAPQVLIINQAAARTYFPGQDPLGQKVLIGGDTAGGTVVGVVGDTHDAALDAPAVPEVSYPFRQGGEPILTLVIRTAGDPHSFLPAIQHELAAVDPDLGFFAVRTMDELLSSTLARRQFNLGLLAGFAAVALLLVAVGVYGVISFSVARRTREIGIRMALGAERHAVIGLLLREGLALAGVGIGVGLIGAVVFTRVLGSELYQVGRLDPLAFLGAAGLLAGVALMATLIPARRAARVDPMTTLRAE